MISNGSSGKSGLPFARISIFSASIMSCVLITVSEEWIKSAKKFVCSTYVFLFSKRIDFSLEINVRLYLKFMDKHCTLIGYIRWNITSQCTKSRDPNVI